MDQRIAIRQISQRDPSDTRFPEGPLVTVSGVRDIVLREGPGTDTPRIMLLNPGRVLAATGRNALGDWIQVQTASEIGWVSSSLMIGNHDVMSLPVISGS
jgi:hypothetical protein